MGQSGRVPAVCLARKVVFLAQLPQVFIEHQRRVPGREVSRNMARQPGFAQSCTREIAAEVTRSSASLAIRARVACTGALVSQTSLAPGTASARQLSD
jgi:hypothetical protein